MTDTTDDGPAQVRPIAAVLQDIQAGTVADEASRAMQDVVAAVNETGKKGELIIKLTIQPLKGNASALSVSGDVTVKIPKPEAPTGIFFYDAAGNLLRENPRQATIPGVVREIKQAVNHNNIKEL